MLAMGLHFIEHEAIEDGGFDGEPALRTRGAGRASTEVSVKPLRYAMESVAFRHGPGSRRSRSEWPCHRLSSRYTATSALA